MPPGLHGIHAVKLPVRDLAESRAWYERTLLFVVELEFPDADAVVRGVSGHLPGIGGTWFALRESPGHAAGVEGFNLVNLLVDDRAALEDWAAWLDELDVPHSPIIDATLGWIVVLNDPNGIEIHLYTEQPHHIDQSERPGYGRTAPPATPGAHR
jgi:catechol 2,3-dioxygenase-like lactoylglutathione lyase family enzyme